MTASKQAGEPDRICFNYIIEVQVIITSIIIKINFYIINKREGVAPGGLASLLVAMSFGDHFGQPVPIATHPPIGQVVLYRRMRGDWQRLAEKTAKTDSSWRGRCAMVRAAAACFVVVCVIIS